MSEVVLTERRCHVLLLTLTQPPERSQDNLHFDHIIPYSKGGSSRMTDNVQILRARHNLEKSARITG